MNDVHKINLKKRDYLRIKYKIKQAHEFQKDLAALAKHFESKIENCIKTNNYKGVNLSDAQFKLRNNITLAQDNIKKINSEMDNEQQREEDLRKKNDYRPNDNLMHSL